MPEHVDLLEQVAQELSEKAEKETNPKERKQLGLSSAVPRSRRKTSQWHQY